MMEKIKNNKILSFFSIFLFIIIISIILSYPVGLLNDYLFYIPQGFSSFIIPSYISVYLNGFIFSYLFLVVFLSIILVGNKWRSLIYIVILLLPVALFFWDSKVLFYKDIRIIITSLVIAEVILFLKPSSKPPTP